MKTACLQLAPSSVIDHLSDLLKLVIKCVMYYIKYNVLLLIFFFWSKKTEQMILTFIQKNHQNMSL